MEKTEQWLISTMLMSHGVHCGMPNRGLDGVKMGMTLVVIVARLYSEAAGD